MLRAMRASLVWGRLPLTPPFLYRNLLVCTATARNSRLQGEDGAREDRRPSSSAPGRGGGRGGRGNGGRGGGGRGREAGMERGASSLSAASNGMQRLAKVMAAAGVASRRACEALIAASAVRVNGKVVTEQGVLVDASRDKVEVHGKALVATKPEPCYFALNKPKGYICSSDDGGSGKRAIDLLEPWMASWRGRNPSSRALPPRLYTVGRLDVASTGLIFVTNDGHWAQRVIHPSANLTKEYIVLVNKSPTKAQMTALRAGVEIEGIVRMPVDVSLLEGDPRLRITVSEGKKHEVRLLVDSVGLEVLSLKRVRIGGYRIPRNIGLGGYKELSAIEVRGVTDLSLQARLMEDVVDVSEGTIIKGRLSEATALPTFDLPPLPADVKPLSNGPSPDVLQRSMGKFRKPLKAALRGAATVDFKAQGAVISSQLAAPAGSSSRGSSRSSGDSASSRFGDQQGAARDIQDGGNHSNGSSSGDSSSSSGSGRSPRRSSGSSSGGEDPAFHAGAMRMTGPSVSNNLDRLQALTWPADSKQSSRMEAEEDGVQERDDETKAASRGMRQTTVGGGRRRLSLGKVGGAGTASLGRRVVVR